jgi:hypothetical protein
MDERDGWEERMGWEWGREEEWNRGEEGIEEEDRKRRIEEYSIRYNSISIIIVYV